MNLEIGKGKTFSHVLRYGIKPFVYKAITGITRTAPARVEAAGHGIIDGWPVAIVSVNGMREINAECDPPHPTEYRQATVVDANTVEFNDINASQYRDYVSGGYLQLYTPVDLIGSTPRMVVKTREGGEIIASSDAAHILDGALAVSVTVDNTLKTISFVFSDEVTAAIDKKFAVFGCELEDSLGAKHYLGSGEIKFVEETAT